MYRPEDEGKAIQNIYEKILKTMFSNNIGYLHIYCTSEMEIDDYPHFDIKLQPVPRTKIKSESFHETDFLREDRPNLNRCPVCKEKLVFSYQSIKDISQKEKERLYKKSVTIPSDRNSEEK